MKYVLFVSEGDKEIIDGYIQTFKRYSRKKLIQIYNKQYLLGFTGVRRQALYLCALGNVFYRRFGDSPITSDGPVLSMNGEIARKGKGFRFLATPEEGKVPEPAPPGSAEDSGTGQTPEPEPQKTGGTYRTADDRVKIVFTSLVVRVKSIVQHFGSLDDFLERYHPGGITNGKLLVMAEMKYPPDELAVFVEEALVPRGMQRFQDFLFIEEVPEIILHGQPAPKLPKPIPECLQTTWLDGEITEKGYYVWLCEIQKSN